MLDPLEFAPSLGVFAIVAGVAVACWVVARRRADSDPSHPGTEANVLRDGIMAGLLTMVYLFCFGLVAYWAFHLVTGLL